MLRVLSITVCSLLVYMLRVMFMNGCSIQKDKYFKEDKYLGQ